MDKFEYKVKADEIKELISRREYAEAAELADEIDWRRVKSVMMLCTISDLYKINRRYEDAKNMLLLAYERRPGGRTICYSLCELCIKTEDFVRAVQYYQEFKEVAPRDSGLFVLKYKILEAQDASLEERIEVLEELKSWEYREKWAYELAYLYHRVGLATRCVEECDELILWFGDGKYVVKAMELKMLHQPLTPSQQEKYDHRFDSYEHETVAEETPAQAAELTAEQDIYTGQSEEALPENNPMPIEAMPAGVKEVVEPLVESKPEEMEIRVKTVDVGQYNTINLQAELAAGLQEVLRADKITQSIVEPMMDTDSLDYPEVGQGGKGVQGSEDEEMEGTEVFFGETGEIGQVQPGSLAKGDTSDLTELTVLEDIVELVHQAEGSALEETFESKETFASEEEKAGATEQVAQEAQAVDKAEEAVAQSEDSAVDETAAKVMEQMRLESMGIREEQALTAQPPKELAKVLTQEPDGQFRIVMPEREAVEKQITGQLNLQDILAEWERVKKENEERRKEEVREFVKQHTGVMFDEYDIKVRDTLLGQLEKEAGLKPREDEVVETEVEESQKISKVESDSEEADSEVEELEEIQEVSEAEESEEEAVAEGSEVENSEEESDSTVEELEEIVEVSEEEASEEDIAEAEEAKEETGEENSEEAEAEETAQESNGEPKAEEIAKEPNEVPDSDTQTEKPKVRSLTREERELYAPFIQSRSAKEMLVKAIDGISMAAYTGNLIITGEEGMDTMGLAKRMIREIQMTDSNFSGKVAKISGNSLNQRDVEETIKGLNNGALIIKKASGMTKDTAENLHKVLQQETLGIVVVLEDTKKSITKLLLNKPKLLECFTARVDLEPLSNTTLASFGQQYAREMEYSIDTFGVMALHSRIEELQTSDHVVTVMDVKAIVDEAIRRANKKSLRHFVDILMARRYDDEDMIVLTERDFE